MARFPVRRRPIRNAAVVLAGVLLPMMVTTETVASATDTAPASHAVSTPGVRAAAHGAAHGPAHLDAC